MTAVIRPHHVIQQLGVLFMCFIAGAAAFALLGTDSFMILLAIGLLAMFLCTLLYFSSFFTAIILTEKGVKYERGVLGKRAVIIPYEMVSDVQSTQSFAERLFGLGTIFVNTAGSTTVEIVQHDLRYSDIELIIEAIEKHPYTAKGGAF